jgi:hypothetical protein
MKSDWKGLWIELIHLWVRIYFGAKEYGIGGWPDYPDNSCPFFRCTDSCDYCEIVETVGLNCKKVKSLTRWGKHQKEKHNRTLGQPGYRQVEPGCKRCKKLVRYVINEYLKLYERWEDEKNK